MQDIVIIGSGPAGISAALYATRGGLSVTVLTGGIGELSKAEAIDNYYGMPGISGTELYLTGIAQAKSLGIEIIEAEVTHIGGFQPFEVEAGGKIYPAKAVVIATGRPRKKLRLKGAAELEGKGVSYCAVCDGFFYRGKPVGVLGAGAYALSEAMALTGVTSSVTLFTNGEDFQGPVPDGILLDRRPLEALLGSEKLEGVLTKEGDTVPVDGLFVALGTASGTDFAASVGIQVENGFIKIDRSGATNVPGIFAAGDVTGGFLQLTVAVGEGATAGNSAVKYVKSLK